MKKLTSKKGVALIVTFTVIVVVSAYLSSYVIWAIWDQRNLMRQQEVSSAIELARAGLNRAILDLYQDTDSWLDGEINGYDVGPAGPVGIPNSNAPDQFYTLYSQNLENGSYTVEIDYLQSPKTCASGCSFFDKRIWVRSTGTTLNGDSSALEQIVIYYGVKNLTQGLLYTNLQPAINEANDNDNIGVSAITLTEGISISSAGSKHFNIKGCYDFNFGCRSCSQYYSVIQGNVAIGQDAVVNLSGVTIE